jgi:hypothetical protein
MGGRDGHIPTCYLWGTGLQWTDTSLSLAHVANPIQGSSGVIAAMILKPYGLASKHERPFMRIRAGETVLA